MNDDELLARLRAADPADRAPAAPERWIQDLTEATMTESSTTPSEPGARRGVWLLAVAAAVIIAGIGGYALTSRTNGTGIVPPPIAASSSGPTTTQLQAPPATDAKCMVPNATTLKIADLAFAGTVSAIDGDQVTLDADFWYLGGPTDQVVVTATPADLQALLSAVSFEDGQRYLVAAHDGNVMVCGFSAPYDASLASVYGEAFPG